MVIVKIPHVIDDVIYQAIITIDSKAFSFRWDFSVIVFSDMDDDDLAMGSLESRINFLCLEHSFFFGALYDACALLAIQLMCFGKFISIEKAECPKLPFL